MNRSRKATIGQLKWTKLRRRVLHFNEWSRVRLSSPNSSHHPEIMTTIHSRNHTVTNTVRYTKPEDARVLLPGHAPRTPPHPPIYSTAPAEQRPSRVMICRSESAWILAITSSSSAGIQAARPCSQALLRSHARTPSGRFQTYVPSG